MATLVTATEKKVQAGVDEKPERKPQRARVDDKFKIFCGTANESLADEVCAFLGLHRGQAMVTRFKDGEAYVQIQENVRGADVFVIQPTCRRVDEHLMELLLMIDALKRASARRITAVIPYFGYARQDRKEKPRCRYPPSLWPICSPPPALTVRWSWICTRRSCKASSTSQWTTCLLLLCWWTTSGS